MSNLRNILRTLAVIFGIAIVFLAGMRVRMLRQGVGRTPEVAAPQPDMGTVADFSFKERSGQTIGLVDLKGKLWVADFIFTRCGGPCPLMTTRMSELSRAYEKQDDVKFVSFSVDPNHDTPKVLSTYADHYGAGKENWYFLTGDQETMFKMIRTSFHLALESNTTNSPVNDITHSVYFVLMDRSAHILGFYNSTEPKDLEALRKKIDALL